MILNIAIGRAWWVETICEINRLLVLPRVAHKHRRLRSASRKAGLVAKVSALALMMRLPMEGPRRKHPPTHLSHVPCRLFCQSLISLLFWDGW